MADHEVDWHALTVEAVLARTQTTPNGLTKPEAATRLARDGPNALTAAAPRTLLGMIWSHFNSIITYILLASAIIAGIFQEWPDLCLILLIIVVNTFLGVFQEGRAEKATRAIRNMVASAALVSRNNKRQTVPAESLVVGDVVHLTAGDRVPADIRWIETSNVQVTEAALTGESLPITKSSEAVAEGAGIGDRTSMAWSGTLVFTGQGSGVVVGTGNNSAIGRLNKLMTSTDASRTPLLDKIDGFGRGLSLLCILVAIVTFFIAWGGRGVEWQPALTIAVSVAVALIPEGLGIVVTITLSAGVQAMAQRGVIVRQLPAVETLGSVTVICSDKTGTLTRNEMTAVTMITAAATLRATGRGYNPDGDVKLASASGGLTGTGAGSCSGTGDALAGDEEALNPAQRANLRQLLLVAALCNDSTLMPTSSLDAQAMLANQPIMVPLPGEAAAAVAAADAAAAVSSDAAQASGAAASASNESVAVQLLPAATTAAPAAAAGAGTGAGDAAPAAGGLASPQAASATSSSSKPGAGPTPLAVLSTKIAAMPPEVAAATSTTGAPVTVQTPKPGRTAEVAASVAAARQGIGRPMEWNTTGDPTEAALLALAMKSGLNLRTLTQLSHACPRIATLPFDSDKKYMATMHDLPEHVATGAPTPAAAAGGAPALATKRVVLVKGAPEVLLARCASQASQLTPWRSEPLQKARWLAVAAQLSREGLRVLALCQKVVPATQETLTVEDVTGGPEPSLQLNCLVGIIDPPRDDATAAIKECHAAGIRVTMITGDHAETAATIGGWMGLPAGRVITGAELTRMTDEELRANVEGCSIFARATPEHKLRIVQALQYHGHVCAMTGDGVNDAPALKAANIGVAMGITGTEVAKEAGKMILTDDNFASIAAAVRQGRGVYSNIVKQLTFMLSTSMAQGLSIAVAIAIGIEVPLTAIQVLWVNMVTAATLGLVLGIEQPEADVMERPPRRPNKGLVGTKVAWRTLLAGVAIIAVVLGNAEWTLHLGGDLARAHTVALNTLVMCQALYCLSCRFENRSSANWSAVSGNPWLTSMVLLNAGLQCLITYTPALQTIFDTAAITGVDWARVLLLSLAVYILVETEKVVGPRYVRPFVMPAVRAVRKWVNATCGCCCVDRLSCCGSRRRTPTIGVPAPTSTSASGRNLGAASGHGHGRAEPVAAAAPAPAKDAAPAAAAVSPDVVAVSIELASPAAAPAQAPAAATPAAVEAATTNAPPLAQ